jgi:PleD family two-component response regulator
MRKKIRPSILIIEPNQLMAKPYAYIPISYNITRVTSLETAFEQLIDYPPGIVFLSTSFQIHKLLDFLTELQHSSKDRIVPLILTIDLDHRLNFVPGTYWGGEMGILSSLSTETEVLILMERLVRSI